MDSMDPAEFMKVQLANAQKKYGKVNCYAARNHYIRQFGIPLPSLALQYMFGVENLPMGRFYGFSGATQSMKSSICFWLLRNIMEQGGLGLLVETERKVSDTLMEGIIGMYLNALLQFNAISLEQAEQMVNEAFGFYKKNVPGKTFPYGICWDSLRGVLSEETSKKIDKEGGVTKQFSSEANSLSKFFAKMVEELSFWPMMLFFVQHEKKKQADGPNSNPHAKSTLGGDAPAFHATVLTQCVVTQKVKEGAANPYADVQFRTVKNNLGVLGKRVNVTIHFDQRTTEEGQQIHNYWFNWAKADCDMLLSDKLANKAEVKAALDLEEFSSQKGYYRSKILGIEKGTASEVIEILNSDEHVDTLKKLKRALRIQRNLRFDEVEWVQDGGTKKTPLYDWKVKEGVDLKEIVSISEEEYMAQQAASPDSEELTNA
jgi:RecA/RadA recombinase